MISSPGSQPSRSIARRSADVPEFTITPWRFAEQLGAMACSNSSTRGPRSSVVVRSTSTTASISRSSWTAPASVTLRTVAGIGFPPTSPRTSPVAAEPSGPGGAPAPGGQRCDDDGVPEAHTFDPYAPGSDERYAAMAQVRATAGFVETPAGWYFATAAGVQQGLRDVEKFVGSFIDTSALADDDVMISAIPEPRHGRIRRVINTVVAAHRTIEAEPFIREQARVLLDDALDVAGCDGTVDLVATVADPLPSTVIAHMLGVPVEDQEHFRIWSDELLAAQNAGARVASPPSTRSSRRTSRASSTRAASSPSLLTTSSPGSCAPTSTVST